MKKRVRLKVTSLCGNYTLHRSTHPNAPNFYLYDNRKEFKLVGVFPSYGSIQVAKGMINRLKITNLRKLKSSNAQGTTKGK